MFFHPQVTHPAHKRPPYGVATSVTLALATALPPAALSGHVMPNFSHTLISLGLFAIQDCTIVFTQTAVTVYHPDGHPSSQADVMRLVRISGTFLSPPRPLTPRM